MLNWLAVTEAVLDAARPTLPLIDRARCLAVRYPATGCDLCSARCPREAISRAGRPTIDLDRCDGCGICAAACPTGALESAPILRDQRAWLTAIGATPRASTNVRCDQAAPEPSAGAVFAVPCVGALRPADLVEAVASGATGVDLRTGDCSACPRGAAIAGINTTIATARRTLAVLGRSTVDIDLVQAPLVASAGSTDRRFSRRELFRFAPRQARRVAIDLARGSEPAQAQLTRRGAVPGWRLRLGAALAAAAGLAASAEDDGRGLLPVALGVASVTVGDGCDGCGLCVLACPHTALAMIGERAVPSLDSCTACGVCAEVCPLGAVQVDEIPLAAFFRAPLSSLADGLSVGSAASAIAGAPPTPVEPPGVPGQALVGSDRLTQRGVSTDLAMRTAASNRVLPASVKVAP